MVDDIVSRSTKIDHKASVVESPVMPNIGSAAFDFAEYIIKKQQQQQQQLYGSFLWMGFNFFVYFCTINCETTHQLIF